MTEDSRFQASKGTTTDDVVFVILYGHGSLSCYHASGVHSNIYGGWWMRGLEARGLINIIPIL